MKRKLSSNVVIYQTKSGAIELRGDLKDKTVWASLNQIADIFERDKSVVSKHIKNIFNESELNKNSVVAFFATTASDGKKYKVEYFNLDLIISVGYRVNSVTATKFRQWATTVLRSYLIEGFAINRPRIAKNYHEFIKTVEEIKSLLPSGNTVAPADTLELIKLFADTWLSLDAYDKDKLNIFGSTKRAVVLTAEKLTEVLAELKKQVLLNDKNADLFGIEKEKGVVSGILGNILQSFSGKDVYPTVENKAAHLLYFMVKNHPFIDGNKRSGAYAFIWFLKKFGNLDLNKITPQALTALTILVAESDPKLKDRIIRLILQLLK